MAGSGKTTLIQRLQSHLYAQRTPPYIINMDPAVTHVPYSPNIDIRDTVTGPPSALIAAPRSPPFLCAHIVRHGMGVMLAQVKYKEVMKQYGLGPNGGILTSCNLFATRFDQVRWEGAGGSR